MTRLLRRMRGKVFRASRLLDQTDTPWRRRRLLDSLASRGERVQPVEGDILRLIARVPYRASARESVLVFPGHATPRKDDLRGIARLTGRPGIARTQLRRLVVIDTETTGLLDRRETVPFLVGLGSFGSRTFVLEQYFMEDFESEPALMRLLARRLRDFYAVLSYNGAVFDLPLLRRRFGMHGLAEASWHIPHWDVLPTARRLWGCPSKNDEPTAPRSCTLTDLEPRLFGFHRARGIEDNRIPEAYHDYLGGRRSERLAAVFDHNAQDILTTAALAVTLARVVRNPRHALRHGLAGQAALEQFLEKVAAR
jgi:uncharacterized protein YprB with RNaseH-like and TPR domain